VGRACCMIRWLILPPPLNPMVCSASSRIGTSGSRHRLARSYRRNRSTNRKKIARCGFQLRTRKIRRRPEVTTWHGSDTNAVTNVRNSHPSTRRFSSRCRSCHRPVVSGSINAHHAFRDHARAVMTMYAQLLASVSVGADRARTPPFNWAIRFSWWHRSLAEKTISAGVHPRSLVM
jgi:hypothetical protein